MLHRATSEGTVVIGQPAHAWSRARSPAPGPTPSRRGRRCLAAEQHDIAWIGWERTPERDPETGLPYAFSALCACGAWSLVGRSDAPAAAVPLRRAARLPASAMLLVERFPPEGDEHAQALAGYLEHERAPSRPGFWNRSAATRPTARMSRRPMWSGTAS